MKKVCIIYTGGTIGMTKTEKGYATDDKKAAANGEIPYGAKSLRRVEFVI